MAVALLAPVPEEHLVSALETQQGEGKVAFGSKAWELFRNLDELTGGTHCEVLIYASDADHPLKPPPKATWKARYLGSSLAINGGHKDGMKYRPDSTKNYELDNKGNWAIFWEIDELAQLDTPITIGKLKGFGKPNRYLVNFIPHGPLLIER